MTDTTTADLSTQLDAAQKVQEGEDVKAMKNALLILSNQFEYGPLWAGETRSDVIRGVERVAKKALRAIAEAVMSDAPDTIWLTNFIKDDCGAKLGRGTISDLDHGTEYPEYRRVDLPLTTAHIMADPRVQALVEAAETYRDGLESAISSRGYEGEDHMGYYANEDAALAQLKEPKP